MREDLQYLQQEVRETQEKPIKHTSRFKELAYGVEPLQSREETPRERMRRLCLFPTGADLRWARKGTSLGSPGAKEWLDEILAWSKRNWKWLLGGGSLYVILLAVAARRGK